jgi:bacillithiol biosynthesis cysteine-adding enzyme BshC
LKADCYPLAAVPHLSRLALEYVAGLGSDAASALDPFYSPLRRKDAWMQSTAPIRPAARVEIAAILRKQNQSFGASPATFANIDRLAEGASAVVTGQQVGLFGGPLLTLMKAATAIRLAQDASRAGHPHVPIFWMATEDHDFAEVNHAILPAADGRSLEVLTLAENLSPGAPVGNLSLGAAIEPLLAKLQPLAGSHVTALLRSAYTPQATLGSAFAHLVAKIFSEHGLIVMDASSREVHALARPTLRAAIEHADALNTDLLERSAALQAAGYHAQVVVQKLSSLLFLLDEPTGERQALKRLSGGRWSAGGHHYTGSELLAILDTAPERLSPNALLRPVMQDTLLPTAVYIGGPAEIAYFAQSERVYQQILGRVTPILPRMSATLVEPRVARILHRWKFSLPDTWVKPETLALRMAAAAMPVPVKRQLSRTGTALDRELQSLLEQMQQQDAALGHAAKVAGSKMLYQMNRLRRLSARHMLERESTIAQKAALLSQWLYPGNSLQERELAGVFFLSAAANLPQLLVEHAAAPGYPHQAIFL